jgi:MFS family permease
LAEEFNTDASTIIWIGMSHLVVSGGLLLIFGRLGDAGGKSRLFILGSIIFAIGTCLAPLAPSVLVLIMIRMFVGVGYALIMSNRDALLTMTFPQKQKGLAIGLQGIGLGLGLALGPLLAGIFVEVLSWQAVFWCIAPIAWFAALLTLIVLPRDGKVSKSDINIYQAMLLFLTLSSAIVMLNQSVRIGLTNPLTLGSALIGLTSLLCFLAVQKNTQKSIIDFTLFKSKVYSLGLTVLLAIYLVTNATAAITPFLLIHGFGYSATKTGLLSSLLHGIRPICSPITGWLWARMSSNPLWLVGNIILIGGIFLSGIAGNSSNPTLVIFGGFTLIGWGTAMIETTSGSTILATTDSNRLGSASASVATFRQIGLALGSTFGMAMFVLITAQLTGTNASDITPHTITQSTLISSINTTLFICGAIAVLVTLFMLLYWKPLDKEITSLLFPLKKPSNR